MLHEEPGGAFLAHKISMYPFCPLQNMYFLILIDKRDFDFVEPIKEAVELLSTDSPRTTDHRYDKDDSFQYRFMMDYVKSMVSFCRETLKLSFRSHIFCGALQYRPWFGVLGNGVKRGRWYQICGRKKISSVCTQVLVFEVELFQHQYTKTVKVYNKSRTLEKGNHTDIYKRVTNSGKMFWRRRVSQTPSLRGTWIYINYEPNFD